MLQSKWRSVCGISLLVYLTAFSHSLPHLHNSPRDTLLAPSHSLAFSVSRTASRGHRSVVTHRSTWPFRQNAAGTESTETRFYSREKDAWATLAGTECLCLVFPPCQAPPLGSACCTLRPFLTTEALLSDRLSFAIVRFPVYGARACPHSDRTQSAIIYVDVRIWSN